MAKKKTIIINALSTISQVVFLTFSSFILYRFLLKSLGVDLLGIWALVLATSSLASIANFGISASLVKFIASYKAENKEEAIPKLISTAVLSILAFIVIFSSLIFFLATFILKRVVPENNIKIALELLPYSLVCLVMNSLGGVYTSVLDGLNKFSVRSMIVMISSIIFLALAFILTPKFQLIGIAYAQIIQALAVIIGSMFAIKFYIAKYHIVSLKWDKSIFKEIFSYGMKFQLIIVFTLFAEPITKAFISKFGSLSDVGFFEMANKLVSQVRGIIISANQVLVPVVAGNTTGGNEYIIELYRKTFSIILFIAVPLAAALICFAPLVSTIWIGSIKNQFVYSVYVLTGAMFINILSAPAYFFYTGEGNLNWLLVTHGTIALLNVILGFLLGYLYSGKGAILSSVISIAVGSLVTIVSFHMTKKITLATLLKKRDVMLITVGIIIMFTYIYIYNYVKFNYRLLTNQVVMIGLFCIVMLPFVYINRNFNLLKGLIFSKNSQK